MMEETLLARMTWPEAKAAFTEDRVVVVPIGSVEQHGPHLPVGTDYLVADVLGKMIAGRCPKCLVTPTIPVGYADYHTDFVGSLSVSLSTLEAYVAEYVSYLVKYGAKRILFVNSHGGNMPALAHLSYRLRREGVLAATILWWDILGVLAPETSPAGHGDWIETSMALACDPGAVKMDKAKLPVAKPTNVQALEIKTPHEILFQGVPVHVRLATADFTATGDMPEPGLTPHGDPNIPPDRASAEIGAKLMETIVTFMVEFMREFRKMKLE